MSLQIEPILCHAGAMDNYAYLLIDEKSGESAVVDAAEADAIIDVCTKKNVTPKYIFVTHHHPDHIHGNAALKKKYDLKIIGSELERRKMNDVDIFVKDGYTHLLGESSIQAILTPGHTKGHLMWYFAAEKALFTGDMLFNLCIGGLFEGTPKDMWQSIKKIKSLPEDVRFYPGHEYTRGNIGMILPRQGEPHYAAYLDFISIKMNKGEPIVGNTLGLEKKCNPYLQFSSEDDFVRYFE